MPDTKFTDQELRFIDNMELGLTQSQAAKAAGFKDPRQAGYKLMKRPRVQAELKVRRDRLAKEHEWTREKVMAGIADAIDQARLLGDPSAMIRGFQEINKMCGFHAPEEKVLRLTDDQENMQRKLRTLTEEELLRIAAEEETQGLLIEGTAEVEGDDDDA